MGMKDLEDFLREIKRIDPILLQEQKDAICGYIMNGETEGLKDALEGVLNLLDAITDYIDPIKKES